MGLKRSQQLGPSDANKFQIPLNPINKFLLRLQLEDKKQKIPKQTNNPPKPKPNPKTRKKSQHPKKTHEKNLLTRGP